MHTSRTGIETLAELQLSLPDIYVAYKEHEVNAFIISIK
uniref:Uncharacterized protein n=1 Tax=Arundo donax TaxID=35708 RepID=A0A0A8YIZ2_ARUDO